MAQENGNHRWELLWMFILDKNDNQWTDELSIMVEVRKIIHGEG